MSDFWFIEQSAFRARGMEVSSAPGLDHLRLESIRANADRWASKAYASENLKVVNGEAIIDVSGVLLNSANMVDEYYAKIFGESYTTYPGLISQLQAAESNPAVQSITLNFDTPGGMVAGLDEAAMVLAGCGKKTKAVVGWMSASAGYYLASQCNSIVASNSASSVGSIGTVVSLVDATALYEKMGVKFYTLSSSNAPRKALEPHSEEFKKEVQQRIDYLANIFVDRVAEGRNRATGKAFTKDDVEQNFGRGGLVFAGAALSAGMIDAIGEALQSNHKEATMGAVEVGADQGAIAKASQDGVSKERARVASLLPWMSTDSERINACIKDGSEMTPELLAELSAKAAEKATAGAQAKAEKDEQARVDAEAARRLADVAPVVTGVDTTPVDEAAKVEADEQAALAAINEKSKIKFNKKEGK